MRPLEGRRVALLESRKASEMALMVQRLGGTPLSVPSVREVLRAGDVGPTLDTLEAGGFGLVVVLTAAASDALFAEAARLGRLDAVTRALSETTVACRGPKPLGSLRRHGLAPQVLTPKPHTSDDLLEQLGRSQVAGVEVLVLHYGERSVSFSGALAERGARVTDLSLYDWALPERLDALEDLVRAAIAGEVDAMLFTSQVQFRHLVAVADGLQLAPDLMHALKTTVIVGSIGPVCTRALREGGVIPDVMPASPNGASLVQALGDYVSMLTPPEETAP